MRVQALSWRLERSGAPASSASSIARARASTAAASSLGAVQGGVGLLLAARMGYIAVAENEKYEMRGGEQPREPDPDPAAARLDPRPQRLAARLQPRRLPRRHHSRAAGRCRTRRSPTLGQLLELDPGRGPGPRATRSTRRHGFQPVAGRRRARLGRASPRSACACPTCPASSRSAASRATIRPGPRSAT